MPGVKDPETTPSIGNIEVIAVLENAAGMHGHGAEIRVAGGVFISLDQQDVAIRRRRGICIIYEGDSDAFVVAAAAVIPADEHDGFALVFPVWAGIRAGGDALWIPLVVDSSPLCQQ
jgi:hypothetical protein